MPKRIERPAVFAEYDDFTELVPGVFIGEQSVHIVDNGGEICTWNLDEMTDPSAFIAVVSAVAIAAKHGPHRVRGNLLSGGLELTEMIERTKQHWKPE